MVEKSHDGWWKGQTKTAGVKGWFPSNYVKEMPYVSEVLEEERPRVSQSGAYYAPAESPNPNERIVLALYSYTAQSLDELTFEKGERLIVFDAPSSETNWFRARNDQGVTGLVPRNYVQESSVDSHNPSGLLGTVLIGLIDWLIYRSFSWLIVCADWLIDCVVGCIVEPTDGQLHQRHSGGQSNGVPQDEGVPEELSEDLLHSLHLNSNNNGSGSSSARTSDPATLYDDFIDRPALQQKPWYFGRISRQNCDELLNTYGSDGDFLIRDSETGSKADFSVSLKASPRNKHFRVYVNSAECHLTIGQRRFASLEEMIGHYERHPICTNNDGRKLTLLHPLKAPRDFY